jgi:hypothetical protein
MHFKFNFFTRNCAVSDIMWKNAEKYDTVEQDTDDIIIWHMYFTSWVTMPTNTHWELTILFALRTKFVTRTHSNVTLYVHCLFYCYITGIISFYWSYVRIQSFWKIAFSNNGIWMLTPEDGMWNFLPSPPYLTMHCSETFKTIFSNKAVSCCYNTEPVCEKLLDWHGQIAAFPEWPLTVPSCPPQISQYLSWDLTWISTARRSQLIACQMLQTSLPFRVLFWDVEFNLEQSLNALYTISLYTLLSENNAEILL